MRVPLLSLLLTAAPLPAATFTGPGSLSDSNPAPIRIAGLAAGSTVTLVAERHIGWAGGGQRSETRFVAAADGTIDTSRDAPIAGSYADVSSSGPFWSMQRAGNTSVPADGDATLVATTSSGERLALSVPAWPMGVAQRSVPDFPGAMLARPSGKKGRLPVVIVLGGSEGGAFTAKTYAPMLAAQGFAVLGLPYYSPGYDPADFVPGLPTSFTDIPADRLISVKAWIDGQRDLDGRRVAIWGVSKGGEFAVLAASRLPWITAIVGVVPSDVVWEGWGRAGPATASFSWENRPLPFVPYLGFDLELARLQRGERMEARRPHIAGRAAYPERIAAATIKVEDYAGQMLLIGGDDDRVWPSGPMARAMANRRAAAGLTTAVLTWPDAGHALAGPGTEPIAPMLANGGTANGLAGARSTAWAATIAFLKSTLLPEMTR
ncbi:palmitoyl-CoA hydrolase [Polymorphobacter multimanifer]|uniref:Dienelactone hydrolase n=1 Tax=Polymorphobacter multimanifer TaxID=1070431 RepID=A0A841LAE4_9SPHN|nr:acyl-CoA thioester hydrolase/BAAT C-terminal domain-containing protein [Polymorphobacter multimanifer]MBB6226795.1 dienelactone hydrolase [Polymorphobacter multimanifer]GGI67009.1 palmitoyl-CoA hydrolase [Polymorphobacter multimanifer]